MKIRFAPFLGALLMTSVTALAEPFKPVDTATQIAITQTLTDIAAGADRHDWERVGAAMADEIKTDYSSLFGGDPVTQPSADLINAWAGFLPGFDSTHHMVTNHTVTRIDGQTATAEADFTATHWLDGQSWVLGGRYQYELSQSTDRWVVTALTMQALWETGHREALIQQAAERLASQE